MSAKVRFHDNYNNRHNGGVILCNKEGLRALRKAIDVLLNDETLISYDSTKVVDDLYLEYRRR